MAAAQAAIDAASAALGKATALTAQQALAFRDLIDAAEDALDAAKTKIADSKTHGEQLKAVTAAVDAATKAVAALSAGSTDADADGAAAKIQAAKDALAAGTALTAEEKASATTAITAAETTLDTQRAAIKARRDHAKAMFAALTGTHGTFDPDERGPCRRRRRGERHATATRRPRPTPPPPWRAGPAACGRPATSDTAGEVTQTDTLVVYTDKAAPKSASYTKYYAKGSDRSDNHLVSSGQTDYIDPVGGVLSGSAWVGGGFGQQRRQGRPDVPSTSDDRMTSADTSRLFSRGEPCRARGSARAIWTATTRRRACRSSSPARSRAWRARTSARPVAIMPHAPRR